MGLYASEVPPSFEMDDYLQHFQQAYQIPAGPQTFVQLRRYISNDLRHLHVIYAVGTDKRCIAIICDLLKGRILGHHFLPISDDGSDTQTADVPQPQPPPVIIALNTQKLPLN